MNSWLIAIMLSANELFFPTQHGPLQENNQAIHDEGSLIDETDDYILVDTPLFSMDDLNQDRILKTLSFKEKFYSKFNSIVAGNLFCLKSGIDMDVFKGVLSEKVIKDSEGSVLNSKGEYFVQKNHGGIILYKPKASIETEQFRFYQTLNGGYAHLDSSLRNLYQLFKIIFSDKTNDEEQQKLFEKFSNVFQTYISSWKTSNAWAHIIDEKKILIGFDSWVAGSTDDQTIMIKPFILYQK